MRIVEEISKVVKGMEKVALGGAPTMFSPFNSPQAGSKLYHGIHADTSHFVRGVAKGVNNIIPGTINSTLGLGSGILGGTASWMSGDGFGHGFDRGSQVVEDNISGPLRRAGSNSILGKAINKGTTKLIDFHEDGAGGHDPFGDNVEDWSAFAAENAVTLPLTWNMFGRIGKGVEAGGSAIASKIAPKATAAENALILPTKAHTVANAVESASKAIGKSVPTAAVVAPHVPELTDAVSDVWDAGKEYFDATKGSSPNNDESGVNWGDFIPGALGGIGAYLLANSLLSSGGKKKKDEEEQEESTWSKMLKGVVSTGAGLAGAYGGYRLAKDNGWDFNNILHS